MDFGYPGGPKIDKLAKEGEPNIPLPKSNIEGYNFSYSGLKTAIINLYHKNPEINKADLCASFQKVATEMLTDKTFKLIENVGTSSARPQNNKIVLAGGVSANSYIREEFNRMGKEKGIEIYFPEMKYCTDNAAMIASAGYYNYVAGNISDLSLNAIANLKL